MKPTYSPDDIFAGGTSFESNDFNSYSNVYVKYSIIGLISNSYNYTYAGIRFHAGFDFVAFVLSADNICIYEEKSFLYIQRSNSILNLSISPLPKVNVLTFKSVTNNDGQSLFRNFSATISVWYFNCVNNSSLEEDSKKLVIKFISLPVGDHLGIYI